MAISTVAVGLLAVLGALQGPAHRNEGAPARDRARQFAHPAGRNRGQGFRPGSVLRLAVVRAQQIVPKALEADAVAGEEVFVVQPLDQQRVAQGQDQRGVAARPYRDPFGADVLRQVAA
jgi:hypothetical protein